MDQVWFWVDFTHEATEPPPEPEQRQDPDYKFNLLLTFLKLSSGPLIFDDNLDHSLAHVFFFLHFSKCCDLVLQQVQVTRASLKHTSSSSVLILTSEV